MPRGAAPSRRALSHTVEPHVVAAFFAALGPVGILTMPAATGADTEQARQALAQAEAELAAWIDAVSVCEFGRATYTAGLTARQRKQHDAQQALDAAVGSAAVDLPTFADLSTLWPGLPTEDRRRLLAAGIDAVMLRRDRDIAARTLILWAGEAPADLPARGRDVPLASFAWPDGRLPPTGQRWHSLERRPRAIRG